MYEDKSGTNQNFYWEPCRSLRGRSNLHYSPVPPFIARTLITLFCSSVGIMMNEREVHPNIAQSIIVIFFTLEGVRLLKSYEDFQLSLGRHSSRKSKYMTSRGNFWKADQKLKMKTTPAALEQA